MTFEVNWTGKEPRTALAEKIRLLKRKLGKQNEYVIELLDEIRDLEHKIRGRDKEIHEIGKRAW